MPKALNDHSASPLARLLDSSAASRAVGAAGTRAIEVESALAPLPVRGTPPVTPAVLIKRECVLTRPADEALTRLTEMIRRTTGARISASHAVRCLLGTLGPAWPRLEDELRSLGPMRLPSNARGHEPERDAMEQKLTRAVLRAMRSSTDQG